METCQFLHQLSRSAEAAGNWWLLPRATSQVSSFQSAEQI